MTALASGYKSSNFTNFDMLNYYIRHISINAPCLYIFDLVEGLMNVADTTGTNNKNGYILFLPFTQ